MSQWSEFYGDLTSSFASLSISSIAESSWKSEESASSNESFTAYKYYTDEIHNKYGNIRVHLCNPSDTLMQSRVGVHDILTNMLTFFCHDNEHFETMKKGLIKFWKEERKIKSYGSTYLHDDIPQLRMKSFGGEYRAPANKSMSQGDLFHSESFKEKLDKLYKLKMNILSSGEPAASTLSSGGSMGVCQDMLYHTLSRVLVLMLSSFYRVKLSFYGEVIYEFKSNNISVESRPDLIVTSGGQPLIPIEVCSMLEDPRSSMNKTESSSKESGASVDNSLCESGAANISDNTSTAVQHGASSGHKQTNCTRPTSFYGRIKETIRGRIDLVKGQSRDVYNVVLSNTSPLAGASESTKVEYCLLKDMNSRQLPDVIKGMSLSDNQLENIRKQLFGKMVDHLMGCISEAYIKWHELNKDQQYEEESGQRLINEAWGFFVLHEIVIPVTLYCPVPYIVLYLFRHDDRYKDLFDRFDSSVPYHSLAPTYTVMNWHIDISTQAGRLAWACFLKYNQMHGHIHQTQP